MIQGTMRRSQSYRRNLIIQKLFELVWYSQEHIGSLVQHFVMISFTNTLLHFKMIWVSENVFQKYSALVQDDQVFEDVFQ